MKLLLIYCDEFAYTPSIQTLDFVKKMTESVSFEKVQTAFIQAEAEDIENEDKVFKKIIKNLKWITGKNNTKKVLLHSFAHLSESKAPPEFTQAFFKRIDDKLTNAGFDVSQTPFGYFLDMKLNAPGFSLARVFKDL